MEAARLACVSLLLDRAWILFDEGVAPELSAELDVDPALRTNVAELERHCAVSAGEPLIIDDAARDRLRAGLALIRCEPVAQSYIGVPITDPDGRRIGTLCGVAHEPRRFTQAHAATLLHLASLLAEHVTTVYRTAALERALHGAAADNGIYRDTFDHAAIGIAHTGFDGKIVRANAFLCNLLGYTADELIAKSIVDITHPDDMSQNIQYFMEMVAGRCDRYRMEKRFLMADGAYVWTMLSVGLRRTSAGEPDYMIATVQDISEQKRSEHDFKTLQLALENRIDEQTQQLRERNRGMQEHVKRLLETHRKQAVAEQRLRTITDQVPAMIGYWNRELRCTFANAAHEEFFSIPAEQIVGMSLVELMGKELYERSEPFARAVFDGKPQHFQRHLVRPDGSLAYVDVRYMPDLDENGEVRGFQVLATDITLLHETQQALEEANRRLGYEAATDYMTGLFNRSSFNAKGKAAYEAFRAQGRRCGLVLIDLDAFKSINDGFGHQTGDDVLRIVGRILRDELRESSDVAARLGGDEFGILCQGYVNEDRLCRLAERVRSKINKEIVAGASGIVTFSASFGVATCDEGDAGFKDIYVRSDLALYEAKAGGRNRVAYRSAAPADAAGSYVG